MSIFFTYVFPFYFIHPCITVKYALSETPSLLGSAVRISYSLSTSQAAGFHGFILC